MVDDVERSIDFGGRPMPDGRQPEAGGWNRIHFVVASIAVDWEGFDKLEAVRSFLPPVALTSL